MAYTTALIDIRGGSDITLKCCLENLESFVADLKEEPSKSDKNIYTTTIIELQNEIGRLNEVIEKGFENVTKLKADSKMWQETCIGLIKENKKLTGPKWIQD